MEIFEIRSYQVHAGGIDEWVDLMEQHIIPFATSKGIKVHGSFRGVDNPNAYTWIRSFPSAEERETLTRELLTSEHWVTHIKPTVLRLLDKSQNVISVMQATEHSPIH